MSSSGSVLDRPFTAKFATSQSVTSGGQILPKSDYGSSSSYSSVAAREDNRPDYMTKPLSTTRWEFGRKLTVHNKKYEDMGIKLRTTYVRSRVLTREEEIRLGKFSVAGHTLDRVRERLCTRLQREPSMEEWADACRLSVSRLEEYRMTSRIARNRLVQHNMRLVDFWVRRLIEHTKATKFISYYELVMVGTRGLSAAAEKYDGRGPFIRLAQHYVRFELYKGLAEMRPEKNTISQNGKATMIYLRACKAAKLLNKVRRENSSSSSSSAGDSGADGGYKPVTDKEIARYLQTTGLHVSEATIKWARAVQSVTIVSGDSSLTGDAPGGNNSGDFEPTTYLDLFLKADQSDDHSIDRLMWKVDFNAALDCLAPQEKRTLTIRYGLGPDGQPRSVARTAELMCVTPEAVRLIVSSALDKLRACPHNDRLVEGPPQEPLTTTNGRVGVISY